MQIPIDGLAHQMSLWRNEDQDARLALIGPLGCGKTYSLAIKTLKLSYINGTLDGMLVVPTYSLAQMVHVRDWPEIWSSLGVNASFQAGKMFWEFPWGGRLWIRTAENPQRLVGTNLAYCVLDEPAQMVREAWDRSVARVRHPKAALRQVAAAGTPEGINWFADLFQTPTESYRTIWAKEWHPDMDLVDYQDKLRELYGYDRSLWETYARGRFVPLRLGRVYKPFDRLKHVGPVEYNPNLPLVLSADFNVDAMRWCVMQFPAGRINVLDEVAMGDGTDTEKAALEFVRRWGLKAGHSLLQIAGDASGGSRSTRGSQTDYAIMEEILRPEFTKFTVHIAEANPFVKDRTDQVNYHLSGRGRTVMIAETASSLITDLERVTWKTGSAEIDKRNPKLTHSSDAFGYAVWTFANTLNVLKVRTGRVRPQGMAANG